jgi:methylated-DNA-protein-cysteine methyltransferase-like protein
LFARVHAVVRKIPRGKVATYGDVAKAAGSPGAARQVVWALRQGSALPWHRVLGAKGWIRLGGDPGFEQQMRLRSEGIEISGRGRVDLEIYGAKLKASRSAGGGASGGSAGKRASRSQKPSPR